MTIYVARGAFKRNGDFDPSQIEEGLQLGMPPQIVITPQANNDATINAFYNWVKNKNNISNIPLKITSHGIGEFYDCKTLQVEESIKTVVKYNERLGRTLIEDVNFHAGTLFTFEEGHEKFRIELNKGKKYTGLESLFTSEEYLYGMKKTIKNMGKWVKYGNRHGINVTVENIYPADYDTKDSPLETLRGFSKYYNYDVRFKDSSWGLGLINLGIWGIGHDMAKITDGYVCIDIEHFDGAVEHSREFNFETMGERKPKTKAQQELLELGIWVEYGEPMIFEKEIDPKEYFDNLEGKIKISHLGGEISRFYEDKNREGQKVRKIGSHMPYLFEGDKDPLRIIENDEIRREMGREIEKRAREYCKLLKKSGCEKHVLEIHLGESICGGPTWNHYIGTSYKNIRKFLPA